MDAPPAATSLRLPGPGEVIVAVRPRAVSGEGAAVLSPSERAWADTLGHAGVRARFVGGRVLLRSTLARLCAVPPATLPIEAREGLAPVLGDPWAGLWVSISHGDTTDAVAIAGAPVGVDVEETCPPDHEAVAEVVMTEPELAAFRALPASGRPAAFLRLWTRKEAVLKAAGVGFSVDPRSLTVGIGPLGPPVPLGDLGFALADLQGVPGGVPCAVALAGPGLAVRLVEA